MTKLLDWSVVTILLLAAIILFASYSLSASSKVEKHIDTLNCFQQHKVSLIHVTYWALVVLTPVLWWFVWFSHSSIISHTLHP